MQIYFLHTDPEECAIALCDDDLRQMLIDAERLLVWAHCISPADIGPLSDPKCKAYLEWLQTSALHYHWLAAHADYVQAELGYRQLGFDHRLYQSIKNLRVCVPPLLRNNEPCHPPCLLDGPIGELSRALKLDGVCAYRTYYARERGESVWTKRPAPGWFTRLSFSLLTSETSGQSVSCNQPSGFGCADVAKQRDQSANTGSSD